MSGDEYVVMIDGRVQGVFFRAFIRDNAQKLGIKGEVRNLDDGTVEAIFQGPGPSIDSMVKLCRKGPPGSKVDGLKVFKRPLRKYFEDFSIKH